MKVVQLPAHLFVWYDLLEEAGFKTVPIVTMKLLGKRLIHLLIILCVICIIPAANEPPECKEKRKLVDQVQSHVGRHALQRGEMTVLGRG